MSLSIKQLFTPATQPDWLKTLLANAKILGLKTTQWQAGGITRTILAIVSNVLQIEDVNISIMAQGGFLDFAAFGAITYKDVAGNDVTVYVTPDPSNAAQNPTGAPGWLDALADNVYNVQRIQNTYAGGSLAILNTSLSTYGPFSPATYHAADTFAANQPTYSNTGSLTIPPSTLVGTSVANVTSNGGTIEVTTSAPHTLVDGATVILTGIVGVTNSPWPASLVTPSAWVIDRQSATAFTLRGSNFNGLYVSGGLVYVPTVAPFQADVIGTASNSVDSSGAANANTITQTVTSLLGVACANVGPFVGQNIESNAALVNRCRLKLQSLSPNGPKGAYEFFALSAQQLAPNLTNPLTNLPYNVSTTITRVFANAYPTLGKVYVIIANALGAPNSADVASVDAVINVYATPAAVTAHAFAAVNRNVAAVADVWVPAAINTAATKLIFVQALQSYFTTLPIGGVTDPGGAYTNVVPFDAVLGSVFTAAQTAKIPVQQATLTLNSGTANIPLSVAFGAVEVAVLSPVVPTVNLHSV